LVPKTDCILHKRVVCGDIVSFSYDFALRRASHDDAAQDDGGPRSEEQGDADPRSTTPRRAEIPSNPVVYRLRDDLAWEDVLQSSNIAPNRHFLNGLNLPPFFLSYFPSFILTGRRHQFAKL
jgi:hypothetical protein